MLINVLLHKYKSLVSCNAEGRATIEKISDHCGNAIKCSKARVFALSSDKYIRIYKSELKEDITANFYSVMPNGTTTVGSFILGRVDKF